MLGEKLSVIIVSVLTWLTMYKVISILRMAMKNLMSFTDRICKGFKRSKGDTIQQMSLIIGFHSRRLGSAQALEFHHP